MAQGLQGLPMNRGSEAQGWVHVGECLKRITEAENALSRARGALGDLLSQAEPEPSDPRLPQRDRTSGATAGFGLGGDPSSPTGYTACSSPDGCFVAGASNGDANALFDTFGRPDSPEKNRGDSPTRNRPVQYPDSIIPEDFPGAVPSDAAPDAAAVVPEASDAEMAEPLALSCIAEEAEAPASGAAEEAEVPAKEPHRVLIMDQILLDAHLNSCDDGDEDTPTIKKPEDDGTFQKPQAKAAAKSPFRRHTTTIVLVNIGRDPVTKKNESIYMNSNRPIWVYCSCPFFRRCRVPVFHPEAEVRVTWNLLGFVFIVFEAFLIPFYLAFSYEPVGTMMAVVSVVNVYFMIDVCFNFITGYMDQGVPILALPRIRERYLCTWFTADFLSGIPWEWIPADGGPVMQASKNFRFLKGLRLLRILRLLRLMRMGLVGDAVEVVIESNRLFVFGVGVLRVLFLLFGVTHWAACAWYIVGSNPAPDEADTWVNHFIHDIESLGVRYTYALYFTLTTMTTVGYGDIAAQNFTEVKFVLVLLLFASIIFAGLMGALTDLIQNLNNDSNARSDRKVMLSRYMRWRAVPRSLFMSVREHLLFLWETNEFDEYEGFIKEQLPPTLKKELSYHIYGRILRRAPFFAWMRGCEVCLKDLAQSVNSLFLSKGDYLFHVGMPNEHIYVLLKGTLYISQNEKLAAESTGGDAEEKKKEEEASHHDTGFTIPRNKEANAVDVVTMMIGSITHHNQLKAELEQQKVDKVKDLLKGNSLDLNAEDEEETTPKKERDILEAHIDSRILDGAFDRLARQDIRFFKAARYIQRRWRKNHGQAVLGDHGGTPVRLSAARSKYVHAPGYLGESCLWSPLHEWEKGPVNHYPYAARCETRGEFVYVSRSAVKGIIDRFSPWLGQRFEYFRQSVLDNIRKVEEGKQAVEESPVSPTTGGGGGGGGAGGSPAAAPSEAGLNKSDTPRRKAAAAPKRTNYDMAAADLPECPQEPAILVMNPVQPSPRFSNPVPPSCVEENVQFDGDAVARSSGGEALSKYDGEALANGRQNPQNYSQPSSMYYAPTSAAGAGPSGLARSPRGAVGASPLSLVLQHSSRASTRTFKAAAAAAVARVAQHVTPPSAPVTPSATPREYPGAPRPGSSARGSPAQEEPRASRSGSRSGANLQEPLLPRH